MWSDRNIDEQIYDHRPRENGGINHMGMTHSQTLNQGVMLNGSNGTNGNGPPRTPIYGRTANIGFIDSGTNGNGPPRSPTGNGPSRSPIYGTRTTIGSLSSNHINHIDGPDLTGMSSSSTLPASSGGDQQSNSFPPPPPIESNYASVNEHPTPPMDGSTLYGRVNHNQMSQDNSTYGSILYGRLDGPMQNPNASDLMNSCGVGMGIGTTEYGLFVLINYPVY